MDAMQTVDMVEELRLRRWARENYVPPAHRDLSWHPIILEEMRTRDDELESPLVSTSASTRNAVLNSSFVVGTAFQLPTMSWTY